MYTTQRMQWGIGGGGLTEAVKKLLIANGVVFFLQIVADPQFTDFFELDPRLAISRFHVWRFVTYMFLHANIFHILVNMFVLWMFGSEVERMWGAKAFYRYYFITGIGAGIFHAVLVPSAPTIGASGAVIGILTAFVVMFPDRPITIFPFFITTKARTYALILAVMSLYSGMRGSQDRIAHFAHLGGMLVGYIYMKRGSRFDSIKGRYYEWRRTHRMRVERQNQEERDKLRKLVDQVLDKANEVGMENLTRDEKILLKRASKILNKEKKWDQH